MQITLSPEMEALVRAKVESGEYPDESQVLEDSVRLFAERERMRRQIEEGLAQAERGELVDGDTFFDELLAEIDRRKP